MGFEISKKYLDADPRKLADWQVAEGAEEHINSIWDFSTKIRYERR